MSERIAKVPVSLLTRVLVNDDALDASAAEQELLALIDRQTAEPEPPFQPDAMDHLTPGATFDQTLQWTVAADANGALFAHRPNDALPIAAFEPTTIRNVVHHDAAATAREDAARED